MVKALVVPYIPKFKTKCYARRYFREAKNSVKNTKINK
ncbi:hypothetical protein CSCA_4368 [Clostridium scatologenes]|uniref:Uncharacterized protein n=1 Tax=Clostridium scatologenes TaxID=1548 RepID=A0A0E3K3W9_CLOSL|nr:hypothetical protein CSCA_4368 [Clostridium scatologenes]